MKKQLQCNNKSLILMRLPLFPQTSMLHIILSENPFPRLKITTRKNSIQYSISRVHLIDSNTIIIFYHREQKKILLLHTFLCSSPFFPFFFIILCFFHLKWLRKKVYVALKSILILRKKRRMKRKKVPLMKIVMWFSW